MNNSPEKFEFSIICCWKDLYPKVIVAGLCLLAIPVFAFQSPTGDAVREAGGRSTNRNNLAQADIVMAIVDGNLDLVTRLVKQGADVNLARKGGSPLDVAVCNLHKSSQNIKIVKLLMDHGARIGRETLPMATGCDSVDEMQFLIAHGADVNGRSNERHLTPLFFANTAAAITTLLDHGADINSQNDNGETALAWAASTNKVDLVKLLIERGADVNLGTDVGMFPIDGVNDVIKKILIQNGAAYPIRWQSRFAYSCASDNAASTESIAPRVNGDSIGELSLIAGSIEGAGAANGPGLTAQFGRSSLFINLKKGMASDRQGNLYIADITNHTIRKVAPNGEVTTLAGKAGTPGCADGIGAHARFNLPMGITVDKDGNVYVADTGNYTVRKISPQGLVSTIAGIAGVPGHEDGDRASARFNRPISLAVRKNGDIFVVDSSYFGVGGFSTVRKIGANGLITTIGSTNQQATHRNWPGTIAVFKQPSAILIDDADRIFVADSGSQDLLILTPSGTVVADFNNANLNKQNNVSHVAPSIEQVYGIAEDLDGNLLLTQNNGVIKIDLKLGVTSSVADSSKLAKSAGTWWGPVLGDIAVTGDRRTFVTNDDLVQEIDQGGKIKLIAGQLSPRATGNGIDTPGNFVSPARIVADKVGNMYLLESGINAVRKIDVAGTLSVFAGSLTEKGFVNGAGFDSRFSNLGDIAIDKHGNVYVSDEDNHAIRKITKDGIVSTLAGGVAPAGKDEQSLLSKPFHLTSDLTGNLYVSDSGFIKKITPNGKISIFAGTELEKGRYDGNRGNASFEDIRAIAFGHDGKLLVSDGNFLRSVSADGTVRTLGDFSEVLLIHRGWSVSWPVTSFYIDDTGDIIYAVGSTVRKLTPDGHTKIIAGVPETQGIRLGANSTLGDILGIAKIDDHSFAIVSGGAVLKFVEN